MSRYVILAFAFMGIGFYELSGGADFEPGSHTTAKALGFESESRSGAEQPQVTEITSRTDLSGTSLAEAARRSLPEGISRIAPQDGIAAPDQQMAVSDPIRTRTLLGTDQPERPAEPSGMSTPEAPDFRLDLRVVDANRVNMRSGPGTSYSVVTRLGKGDAVEVLQDTGDGWLKLRVIETDSIGWMADFLVAASAN
jgi:uncharacterized protein YgiM (DUF1202 family)